MTAQKVNGFHVRSDKGTFRHFYDTPMLLDDSKAFVNQFTKDHKDVLGKHYVQNGGHVPH